MGPLYSQRCSDQLSPLTKGAFKIFFTMYYDSCMHCVPRSGRPDSAHQSTLEGLTKNPPNIIQGIPAFCDFTIRNPRYFVILFQLKFAKKVDFRNLFKVRFLTVLILLSKNRTNYKSVQVETVLMEDSLYLVFC